MTVLWSLRPWLCCERRDTRGAANDDTYGIEVHYSAQDDARCVAAMDISD